MQHDAQGSCADVMPWHHPEPRRELHTECWGLGAMLFGSEGLSEEFKKSLRGLKVWGREENEKQRRVCEETGGLRRGNSECFQRDSTRVENCLVDNLLASSSLSPPVCLLNTETQSCMSPLCGAPPLWLCYTKAAILSTLS